MKSPACSLRIALAVSTSLAVGTIACAQTPAPDAAPPAAPTVPAPAPTAPAVPDTITVTVDGTPLAFADGLAPVEQNSRLLAPLRGIFERLGAAVKFDGHTQTITATKGETHIEARIGSLAASVNGDPRPLSAPPQVIHGATFVPLRFISEALGAKVRWDAPSRTVQITTAEALAAPVVGAIAGIDTTGTAPIITIHAPVPPDVPVTLTADARILAKRGDDPATVATIADLKPGDQVTIKRNPQGIGYDVETDYVEQKGAIQTIAAPGADGTTHVTLADGTAIDLPAGTPIALSGVPATLADLKAPYPVTIRVNPVTHVAVSVAEALPHVEITSIAQDAGDKTLRADDKLTITVVGTPGAKGVYTVTGLPTAIEQPLVESATTPGTYTATLPIPAGFAAVKTPVTAVLSIGVSASPVATATTPLTFDSSPPTITDLAPIDESTVGDFRPDISAKFADQGVGVDPAQTKIVLNDQDVTAQAKITPTDFLLHPTENLRAGTNNLTITIKDLAGNVAQSATNFHILPPAPAIKVVTTDATAGQALGVGDTLNIRAEAKPGGTAKYSIAGGVLSGPMTESSPGIYTAAYVVQKGDSITNGVVTVTLTPAEGGKDANLAALTPVTIAAGAPVAPIFDQPLEGASAGRYVTFSGRGTPNTIVRLTVTYSGKALILNHTGNLQSLDLPVDVNGAWTSELISLDTPGGGSVSFTAQALTVTKNGEQSQPAIVHFQP